MLGSQSYSWRVCGLYKPPHTAGNHSNLMTESKTHDLRSTLTESLHSAQPTIPTASAPNSSSLRLHSSTQNKSTSSTSSWSSVFHYFSSYMTPSLPAMKRTRGTTSSDSITRSGSAGSDSVSGSGSEQGYTCGLWLLLHYVTGANYAYSYVLHTILSCAMMRISPPITSCLSIKVNASHRSSYTATTSFVLPYLQSSFFWYSFKCYLLALQCVCLQHSSRPQFHCVISLCSIDLRYHVAPQYHLYVTTLYQV